MFTHSMNFDLGEDVAALRDLVHRWAQERIKPMAQDIDASNVFPAELWTEMGELGLLGITVEEDYGGTGLTYLAHIVAVEEIARASASVALSYGAHSNLCVNQIKLNGTPVFLIATSGILVDRFAVLGGSTYSGSFFLFHSQSRHAHIPTVRATGTRD